MPDFGFKAAPKGQNVNLLPPRSLHFSSSFFIDKKMVTTIGQNIVHGLGYKPTSITSNSAGDREAATYVDDYQVYIGSSSAKAIVLSQQGT